MGVDLAWIQEAVRDGVPFACAMCDFFWAGVAQERGCGQKCGGPKVGLDFPAYRGPLPASNWTEFCFVCGSPEQLSGLRIVNHDRTLAVCGKHIALVDSWEKARPADRLPGTTLLLLPRIERPSC